MTRSGSLAAEWRIGCAVRSNATLCAKAGTEKDGPSGLMSSLCSATTLLRKECKDLVGVAPPLDRCAGHFADLIEAEPSAEGLVSMNGPGQIKSGRSQAAVLQPSGADRLLHALHVCSGCQIEEMVDELDLSRRIISCHPSNLRLPDHVDCFVALKGSPGRLEFSKSIVWRSLDV
jgi:hypothetical protein